MSKNEKKRGSTKMKKRDAEKAAAKLRKLEQKLWVREYLLKIADFDGETVAPANGADARGEAMATLAGEHHKLLTKESSRVKVQAARRAVASGKLDDSQLADEVRVLGRDQREALAIPSEEAAAWTRLTCEANACWHKAKLANDWASFAPYVDKIVGELKHQASLMDPARDPYDVWLDQYERGLSAASFDAFCEQVKGTVVPLVHAIGERGPQKRPAFMNVYVSEAAQRAISLDLMRLVGLADDDSTLAYTEHPFSEGFAPGDARVVTHIFENDCLSNVFSIIHESGHALYELGVNPSYARTCLEGGTSMGIHESQSRFFENVVGRSREFMGPLLNVLRAHAPEVYGSVNEDELYRAVNIAQPSLIRTEADELTYPLHVMVRYEIERLLFAGEATAADVPELWSRYMREYLGIEVPDDTQGALQDTHWSGGSFGYFPTYALGSAYDAQFVPALCRDHVDLKGACAAGDLAPVRAWLGEHIWQWGRAKDAPELIESTCGMSFDASYYCRYLEAKFSELYGL